MGRGQRTSQVPGFGPPSFLQGQGCSSEAPRPPVPGQQGVEQGGGLGWGAPAGPEGRRRGPGHMLDVHEFLTPKIARDMGHGARKLLFNISAAGGSRLGIRNHY